MAPAVDRDDSARRATRAAMDATPCASRPVRFRWKIRYKRRGNNRPQNAARAAICGGRDFYSALDTVAYADGNVHTNTIENFWALLICGIHGTYVSVEPFHLFCYFDEQAYRYNRKEMTDFSQLQTQRAVISAPLSDRTGSGTPCRSMRSPSSSITCAIQAPRHTDRRTLSSELVDDHQQPQLRPSCVRASTKS